ncbi:hypothetical protein B0H66DRAFT_536294 [Apodospora peruviana]|uniref:Uncharacterized protein n=1 Tax=Apodospora peruviana TaxID=516989 RepID=A0AAE0M2C9_9PEZI|nr:hypothetical protein B0H66DRAFT_536294 [Apodospora peruviana]
MVLQFAKIMVVDASWFYVKLLPCVYFLSWFSVEFLLLMVHGDGLNETDKLEAERILLPRVAKCGSGHAEKQLNRVGGITPRALFIVTNAKHIPKWFKFVWFFAMITSFLLLLLLDVLIGTAIVQVSEWWMRRSWSKKFQQREIGLP